MPMIFTLEIHTNNSAFGPSKYQRNLQIADVLFHVARTLQTRSNEEGECIDTDGNNCGEWGIYDTTDRAVAPSYCADGIYAKHG